VTTEVLTPAPPYVIAGQGPYAIPHPYQASSMLSLSVVAAGVVTTLTPGTDYTVSPAVALTGGGAVTLSAACAAARAGGTLTIVRNTVPEQGWQGVNGPREKGLERQLDRLTQALQDMRALAGRALVLPVGSAFSPLVVPPGPGRALIASPDGQRFVAGPTAGEIAQAQFWAEQAAAIAADVGMLIRSIPVSTVTTATGYEIAPGVSHASRGQTIVLTATERVTIGAGAIVDEINVVVRADCPAWGNAAVIAVGAGARVGRIKLHVEAAELCERGVSLGAGCIVGEILCTSVGQQRGNDSIDAAIIIAGDDVTIGQVVTRGWDVVMRGDGRARFACGPVVGSLYRVGVNLSRMTAVHVDAVHMSERSPNATPTPGNNGLGLGDCEDVTIPSVFVGEAAEHGIYIAGGTSGCSRRISLGEVLVSHPGQCGLKIKANENAHENISIGNLTVVQAAWGSSPGTNEDVLRVERVRGFRCGSVVGRGEYESDDVQSRCGFVGVYLNGVSNAFIGSVEINNSSSHAIHMEDVFGPLSRIKIGSFSANRVSGDAIRIDSPTENLRNIWIGPGFVDGVTGYGVRIIPNSSSAGVTAPIVFDTTFSAVAGTVFLSGTSSPNVRDRTSVV